MKSPFEETKQERVILVHGLWMTGVSMCWLERGIRAAGFETHRFSYPSVKGSLDENIERLAHFLSRLSSGVQHLIGHSLGGVVALHVLHRFPELVSGRVVAMGSPFQDCWLARRFLATSFFPWTVGRCLREAMEFYPMRVEVARDVGVMAGCRPIGAGWLMGGIPGPNDGTVGVQETNLPGASDRLISRVSHFEMLIHRECLASAICFLKTGSFLSLPPPNSS